MSAPYTAFARLYDGLMSSIDYSSWVGAVMAMYQEYIGAKQGRAPLDILDLGCGTGTATLMMAGLGHRVVGVDLSEEMLAIASAKATARGIRTAGHMPAFVHADMTALPFEGRFDLVTCFCDGMNHLSGVGDLVKALSSANRALRDDGLVVFDVQTRYRIEQVLADNTFFDECEAGCCVMENSLDCSDKSLDIRLVFFVRRHDGTYERHEEFHQERWYDLQDIQTALRQAGLEPLGFWDGFGRADLTENTERMVVLARPLR